MTTKIKAKKQTTASRLREAAKTPTWDVLGKSLPLPVMTLTAQAQHEKGLRKYGEPLTTASGTAYELVIHAHEESADRAAYLLTARNRAAAEGRRSLADKLEVLFLEAAQSWFKTALVLTEMRDAQIKALKEMEAK